MLMLLIAKPASIASDRLCAQDPRVSVGGSLVMVLDAVTGTAVPVGVHFKITTPPVAPVPPVVSALTGCEVNHLPPTIQPPVNKGT